VLPEKVILTRAELYEKVWTIPIRTLAKEFGISDVGLAKLCRRHEIPLPGRGYWARIQFGQTPARIALPTTREPRLDSVTIYRSEQKRSENPEPINAEDIPKIDVAEDRIITHRLVTRIERSISRKRTDERGFLLTNQGRMVPVKLCAEALPRALQILDALFTAFDEATLTVEWPNPYNTPLKIVTLDEKLHLFIAETTVRKEHEPTPEEIARQKVGTWWRPNRWDYKSTGRLIVTLESCEFSSIRHNWADGKRRRIEDCLGEVLAACKQIAASVKQERISRAEAEVRRREEEKRRFDEQQRKAEYERKAKVVKGLAGAWQESKLLRDFAKDLQVTATAADLPDGKKQEILTMIEWSLRHAEYVNPLRDLDWTITQFKNRYWY
jgi:hypothetical protein